MPGEIVAIGFCSNGIKIVNETKILLFPFAADNFNISLHIPIFLENVVIAYYKFEIQVRMVFAPSYEKIQFFVGLAVKHVAHHDERERIEELHLMKEALEVFLEKILRNRNSGFSEMPGLTKMAIGEDENFLLFPKSTPMMGQPEMVIFYVE